MKYDLSGQCDLLELVCSSLYVFVLYVLIICVYVCVGGFRVKESFYQQAPAAVAALSI